MPTTSEHPEPHAAQQPACTPLSIVPVAPDVSPFDVERICRALVRIAHHMQEKEDHATVQETTTSAETSLQPDRSIATANRRKSRRILQTVHY